MDAGDGSKGAASLVKQEKLCCAVRWSGQSTNLLL